MSKTKEQALKMIANKKKSIRFMRANQGKYKDIYHIVADFVREIEAATQSSKTGIEFNEAVNTAVDNLDSRFNKVDEMSRILVNWNVDVENRGYEIIDSEKWKDLKVEGITITWSDDYRIANKKNKEETVDVTHLFLEGYFN